MKRFHGMGGGGLLLLVALVAGGCGEKLRVWGDAATAAHDDFQKWTIGKVGEAKVLKAELDRRIRDLQNLEKELTKLDAESRVRLELLPKQFQETERELQTTQRSREKLQGLLAGGGEAVNIGEKKYSRSAAEQMEVSLEVEQEKLQDRLQGLERKKQRIETSKPIVLAKRDSVRKTLIRVKAAREKLELEISEATLAKRFEDAVGGGERGVEEVENRIKQNVEELTVKVRSDIVVSDDVIKDASASREMKDLRDALSKM